MCRAFNDIESQFKLSWILLTSWRNFIEVEGRSFCSDLAHKSLEKSIIDFLQRHTIKGLFMTLHMSYIEEPLMFECQGDSCLGRHPWFSYSSFTCIVYWNWVIYLLHDTLLVGYWCLLPHPGKDIALAVNTSLLPGLLLSDGVALWKLCT